jgi:N-acetylglucosaminyldiphosphoundecaprenol N-acetyl-beta-D-mannosaminyltransferase
MSKPHDHRQYKVLGVSLDALTIAEAVATITARAGDPKQPACYVVKPYVEFLDRVGSTERSRQLLNGAWLRLPDGVSTQWAATYLHSGRRHWWRAFGLLTAIVLRPTAISRQLPQKFGGTAFTWQLLEACARQNLRVYLVGSPNTTEISTVAATVQRQLPELAVVGTWPGRLGELSGADLRRVLPDHPVEQELADDLRQKQPDIVLVGMGFPLQEELIAKLAPQLPHGVLIGEGGTFDYAQFGGRRPKAPAWLQRIGLEWLWRLLLEPSRVRRQLAIPRFIWQVYREE